MLKKLIPCLAAVLLFSTTVLARPGTQSFAKSSEAASFSGFKIGQANPEIKKACDALGYNLSKPEMTDEAKKQAKENNLDALVCVAKTGSEVFKSSVFHKPIHVALVSKDGKLRGIDLTYLTDSAGSIGIQDLVSNGEKVGVTEIPGGKADVYYNGTEEWIGYHNRVTTKNGVTVWTVRILHRVLAEIE